MNSLVKSIGYNRLKLKGLDVNSCMGEGSDLFLRTHIESPKHPKYGKIKSYIIFLEYFGFGGGEYIDEHIANSSLVDQQGEGKGLGNGHGVVSAAQTVVLCAGSDLCK